MRESQRDGAEARVVFVRTRVTMVVGRADDEDLNSVEDILEALQRLVAGSVLELSMTVVFFFFLLRCCLRLATGVRSGSKSTYSSLPSRSSSS